MSEVSSSPVVAPSFPAINYRSFPVLTTEMLAQAYEVEEHQIRQNFKNNRERFVEGKHFFSISGEELKSFRLRVDNFYPQISPKARSLTLWLERGAARHAKMLNTDRAWDVFELLEETFFRVVRTETPQPLQNMQPLPDTPITPDQQCTLQAMVKALVERGGHYANIWSRFNNHFRIARYCQLPQSRMSEAVDYLMRLPVEPKKLPPSPDVAKNATVGIAGGELLPSTPGEMDKRRERICRELYELQDKFGRLTDEIRLCLHPGARWGKLPPELDVAYETLDALNRVAAGAAYTARQAIVSAYQIGKGLRFV